MAVPLCIASDNSVIPNRRDATNRRLDAYNARILSRPLRKASRAIRKGRQHDRTELGGQHSVGRSNLGRDDR